MRSIYKLILPVLLVGAVGCKKFDDSYYKDPNNPSNASATQLIANAELYLPSMSSNAFGVHYPQYLSLTLFTDNSRYITTNFAFSSWYTGPLMDVETALNNPMNASHGPVENQSAVAKILKAYFMWFITDRWGDVPYSEAWKGQGNFTPKYDKQQDIYNALFTLLDEANSQFVLTNGTIKNDIVYNGDVNKWKRLGNTIHLLMALRLSKVDANKGKTEFNKALTNGIMTSNADNLSYPHLAEQVNENFWYNSFTRLGREWYALSKPLVDYMKPLNDPRLPIFGNTNQAGQYVGLEYGKDVGNSNDIPLVSLLGSSLRQQTSPVRLVTYAQALFAKAEAAKLGWITGGDVEAKTNYDEAIKQSLLQWTGSSATFATFIGTAGVTYDPVNALSQIGYQRWVHLFLHGYEGWAEWRRTGFPALTAPATANGGKIPRREGYPTQEANNNAANYNAAVAAFPYGGTDGLNARVWWDKP
ncbi:MAG TPA: SusD/RagB family nutrient-binding outer membrane lipoprotein [Chitinophagaceae bacterium]